MKIILSIIFILSGASVWLSCGNSSKSSATKHEDTVTSKIDSNQKHAGEGASISTCTFENPDTSLSNMQLRDPETATKVLGVTELNGDTTYNFYSVDGKQTLNVTIHPGDGHSIISIFRVRYTNGPIRKAAQLAIRSFKTEKNIELGLAKNELIQRLGKCYSIGDSSKNFIEIQYRLESPQDSKTKLLERQNMPIYYADYKFKNERLIDYEFGFEYP